MTAPHTANMPPGQYKYMDRSQKETSMPETQEVADFWGKVEPEWTDDNRRDFLREADGARKRAKTFIDDATAAKLGRTAPKPTAEKTDIDALQRQIKEKLEKARKQQERQAADNASGNRTILFLSDLSEVVGQFSGIVEIMKGVDQAYGGAAYTALSVFLSVAVNTKKKDDLVNDAIANLRAEYSRMKRLSEIYPSPSMGSCIATVYRLGIEFLEDATSHYKRSTWRRLWDSVVRPPFLLNRKVVEIRSAMTQMDREQAVLLSGEVNRLHRKIDQMTGYVGHLQSDVTQVQGDIGGEKLLALEKERLEDLKTDLSSHLLQPETTLEKYSELLSGSFNRPAGLPRVNTELIMKEEAFKAWANSKSHCMLVLNGKTIADGTSFCWLSPAAIAIAALIKSKPPKDNPYKSAVIELYCQKSDLMSKNKEPEQVSLIINMILQLLEADLAILHDAAKSHSLHKRLNSLDGTTYEDFDRALRILDEVLEHFDLVYIVLDRVDRVKGSSFMQELLARLMSSRPRRAKIRAFCVASIDDDEVLRSIRDLEDRMDEKAFMSLRQDQSRR